MATYVIGDVHGCYRELMQLLDAVAFSNDDRLIFTGDLVNRGPESLEVLRFVAQCPQASTVLGNHDVYAIARMLGVVGIKQSAQLEVLAQAPDRDVLLDWWRQQPFLLAIPEAACWVVHAGLHPSWSWEQAQHWADALSELFRAGDLAELLPELWGNTPTQWSAHLEGIARFRCLLNVLTRMRYVDAKGALDFEYAEAPGCQPDSLQPWFTLPHRRSGGTLCFGHWASLRGGLADECFQALDGGCIWGGHLVAMNVATRQRVRAPRRNCSPCSGT